MRKEPVRLDRAFYADPEAVYALLRPAGPVHEATVSRTQKVWLVVRHAEARALHADPRLSKDAERARALLPPGATGLQDSALVNHMLNADPPDHTRLRRLVNKAFTPRTVARLRPRIEQIADELLAGLAAGSTVDLVTAFAFPLPITVICELLGVPAGDRNQFREWSSRTVAEAPPEEEAWAYRKLSAYLTELVSVKRACPADDLLSDLVKVADEDDRLSVTEVVSMAFLLLVAGHETTVNLIANAVLALLRHPAQLAALRADPALLPGAVEEFLRFEGPVNLATLRFTTEPVDVGEVEIPAGELVMISLLSANRDAGRFAEPGLLDIGRHAAGHLAFGHGIHHCVGAPLARLEAEIAIGRLLSRFPVLELAAEPQTLRWRRSTLIRGLHALPVRLG